MKSLMYSALFLVLFAAPALAYSGTPYGVSTDCKAGVACPYPPNTPKAAYFETRYGTPDAPYSGWENNPIPSVGGGGASK